MSINYYDSRTGELTPVPGSGSGSHIKDEMIAGYEASNLAANAYSVGEQLIYNGKLYTVISPIAVDDDITGKIAESESLSKQLLGYEKKIWKGTEEEWEALSAEEKAKYTTAIITNDTSDFKVVKIPGEFKGATANADGIAGMVVVPHAGDQDKVLRGDGTWAEPQNNKGSLITAVTSLNTKLLPVWKHKDWYLNAPIEMSGKYIWSDGENLYYSHDTEQFVYDKATSTWIPKTWEGLSSFDGTYVWTDGNIIYYTDGSRGVFRFLKRSTDGNLEWNPMSYAAEFSMDFDNLSGNNIWKDGDNVYFSYGNTQAIMIGDLSDILRTKTWNGLTNFNGKDIWTDGNNIYYSNGLKQYVLDKSTSTWNTKTWRVGSLEFGFNGEYVWSDGNNIYYSQSNNQYVLDKSTSNWIEKVWDNSEVINGNDVWSDGNDTYYSNGAEQLVLNESGTGWIDKIWMCKSIANLDKLYMWSDGDNIYYSQDASRQYVLDKSTSTWFPKVWSGMADLDNFEGYRVWSDGTDIYFNDEYVLNKADSTWLPKTWYGSEFSGSCVWSDGDNIYSSLLSRQYVLDKSTSTWSPKTWNGLTELDAEYIWTDGDNIYCSIGTNKQYVLDKATSTWNPKTWNGLTKLLGNYIWSDGNNIYYSNGSNQYVLNKATSTWTSKNWHGKSNIDGRMIWTDGENIYYDDYILTKISISRNY